jgi:SAM-dependent methyltransferase
VVEDRPAVLLRGIDPNSKILELGASIAPMAPRSAGWNVTVVDHATQQELVEKYRNSANVNVANIEKVDFVWRNGPLHAAVPAQLHGTFDVLIASHVIEHIPDPVGFLESAARLLHPTHGVLALAVPDKRWCFDYFKQVSTTGQMLDAHRMGAQRHSAATRFDSSAYVVFDGNRTSWGREALPDLFLPDTLDHAFSEFQAWTPDPNAPYVDCHAWHFTPASFELLILELGAVGLADWHISWLSPRPSVEFMTRLERGCQQFVTPKERDRRRLELMKQILLDAREQTDWLVGAKPDKLPAPVIVDSGFDDAARAQLQQVAEAAATPTFDDAARQQLRQVAEVAVMLRTALRPLRAVWHQMLPLRRNVARLRGRV